MGDIKPDRSAVPDAEIVQLVLGGEIDAFDELVRRTRRPAYRLARRITRNHEDADDVVQESYVKAYRALGRFEAGRAFGPWFYRRLYWETGLVGQVLYLEAEAGGIRGTGIGCFFDELSHQAFGLTGDRFQVLYHFTMGGPVEDQRLQTHPPYQHLARVSGQPV